MAARDTAFVARLREIRNQPVVDPSRSDDEYAAAFEHHGVNVDVENAPQLAAVIRGEEGEVAEALISALDDWAGRRRLMTDDQRWRRLVQIARLADDDAWRSGLRDALLGDELGRLKTLARDVDVGAQQPGSLTLLAMSLDRASERDVALQLLRRACEAHPRDYWVHQRLAVVLVGEFTIEDGRSVRHETSSKKELEEAAVHLRIALVLQPDSTFNMAFLGTVMHRRGDKADALAYLDSRLARYADDSALKGARAQVMFEEDPGAAVAGLQGVPSGPFGREVLERARLMGLGLSKHPERNIKRLRAIIGAEPKDGHAHTDLARLLLQVGDLEQASDYALAATGLRGDRPEAWQLFARAQLEQRRFAEAVEAFRGAQMLRGLRGFNIELERLSRLFAEREREFERKRVTGADPTRLDVRMDLARYCAFSGHSGRAAVLFKEVVAAWTPGGSRRPPGGPRGRPRAPMEILFEAGLVAVLSGDFKFARVCLERNLKADDRRSGGSRERGLRRPSALQLHRWRHDRRLAPIRSAEALGDMSDADRAVWEDLWRKVDKHLEATR
ncbi:MAG: hypothetical protein HRU14_06715 [Planctomycetes bacterium]|nr:hypothetical protein [Planctomycetota bacterium]